MKKGRPVKIGMGWMWLKLGCVVLMLFTLSRARAETKDPIDWSQRWEIYKAYWDDPRPILKAAKEALAHADSLQNPQVWLEIFCAYSLLDDNLNVVQSPDFQKAWDIAFGQNLYPNQVDLLILKAAHVESLSKDERAEYMQKQGKTASMLYEEAMAIARLHDLPRDYNRIIRNYVSYLFTSNEQSKALTLIEDGLAAALSSPDADAFDKMLMQSKAATSFRLAGLNEKAETIIQDLATACDQLPLRSFCATVFYERAGYYAFYSKNPQTDKALETLARSLKLAEEVEDRWCISAVHLQRARIMLTQKNWTGAKLNAEQAKKGFEAMSYLNSAADAAVVFAEAARHLGQSAGALIVLQKTLEALPEDYLRQSKALHRELANLHEQLGEWKEAFTHRTRQLELERKGQTDLNREEISRQMVALGLQIEEERNKILQQENELQARRLREAELERRMRAQIASAGIALFLLSLLVISWMMRKNSEIQRLQRYIEKQVLQRFLPPQIIAEILAGRKRFDEKPHARTVTILFADLVNFTAQAEKLTPEQLSELLHEFFAKMTDVIFAEGGTIDKFIGDAIMVVFGAPHEVDPVTQARQAVSCACSMRRELKALNDDWTRRLGVSFSIRIGIHQGLGVVGSYGSEKRSDYTVIGQTVNLASRIESSAEPNQILVSQVVTEHLAPKSYGAVREFQLKGIEKPVMLYAIMEDPAPARLEKAG
jgi:class 3 adenylate cyclase